MKNKKFSQIYREAAEMLSEDENDWLGCKHYFVKACETVQRPHYEDINYYFRELFYDVDERWYDFTRNNNLISAKQHRITALLLASEIAKSEHK